MSRLISMSFPNAVMMWLTGPIFDKELRVCSRRKRYYVLRSLYLTLLGILVLIAWLTSNSSLGWNSSVYNTSRMGEVGRTVIISIAWFQFIVAQIAAILFFCNAICEEMNHGTLNVLMTTPITTLQIVLGKLLSKLVQLLLIIALSLSTLSIVYIFGGIHWEFIISSFLITLTAVIFTGSMTLFCSGRFKRPHIVILVMITFTCIYYAIGASIIPLLSFTSGKAIWLLISNPMAVMLEISQPQVIRTTASGSVFSWPLHCLVMIGLSVLFVAGTIIRLRKSILTFAFEKDKTHRGRWSRFKRLLFGHKTAYPLELKSLAKSRLSHSVREVIFFVLLAAGYLTGYYCLYVDRSGFGQVIFSVYSTTIVLIIFARTIIGASTAITREKESKSLSALLCCPLSNRQIILGKAKQVYRSNFSGWAILTLNSAVAYLVYSFFIYPNSVYAPGGIIVTSILSVLSIASNLIFIVGFGLYLSVRLKSSTAALVGGLLGYFLWYIIRDIIMVVPIMISSVMDFYVLSRFLDPVVDLSAGILFFWLAQRSLRKYAFK